MRVPRTTDREKRPGHRDFDAAAAIWDFVRKHARR